MRGQPISQWNKRLSTIVDAGTRRSVHGGNAWSLPGAANLRQPQDGAPTPAGTRVVGVARALLNSIARAANPLSEPEDATLTGGTRSLTRRLMGLNVTSAPRKAPAIVSASAMPRRQAA